MAKFGEGAGGTFTLVDTAKFDPTKTTLRDYLKLYIEESKDTLSVNTNEVLHGISILLYKI